MAIQGSTAYLTGVSVLAAEVAVAGVRGEGVCCEGESVRRAAMYGMGAMGERASERFPLTPRRNCLFAPELQWQSRGQRRILQGSTGAPDHEACEALWHRGGAHPFDTGQLPLSYSGDPGVNGVSHRGSQESQWLEALDYLAGKQPFPQTQN